MTVREMTDSTDFSGATMETLTDNSSSLNTALTTAAPVTPYLCDDYDLIMGFFIKVSQEPDEYFVLHSE